MKHAPPLLSVMSALIGLHCALPALPASAQKKTAKPPAAPVRKPVPAPAKPAAKAKPVAPMAKQSPGSIDARSEAIRLVPPTAHNLMVYDLQFTPDGKYAITRATDRALGIWEIATGRLVRRLPSETQIEMMALAPDGQSIVVSDRLGMWTVWDLRRAVAARIFDPFPAEERKPNEIKKVEMHPQGRFAAVLYNHGLGNNSLFLIDPTGGKRALANMPEFLNVDFFAFTPDGNSLYVEEAYAGKILVDLATGKATKAADRPTVYTVPAPRYKYEGKLWESGPVKIIDPASGQVAGVIEPLRAAIAPVIGFLPDPRFALYRQEDDVIAWDMVENVPVNRIKGLNEYGRSQVRLSDDGTRAIFTSPDNIGDGPTPTRCLVRDVSTGDVLLEVSETMRLTTAVLSSDNRLLAIGYLTRKGDAPGSFQGHLQIWDMAEKKKLASLDTELASSFLFLPGNERIVVGGRNLNIAVYDWASGDQLMKRAMGGDGAVSVDNLMLSPTGKDRVLFTSWNGTLVEFDLKTRGVVRNFYEGGDYAGSQIALSPDRTRLAYGSSDGNILLYDLRTEKAPVPLSGHSDGIRALRFTPDNKRLVSSADDGTTRIWDSATHTEVSSYVFVRDKSAKATDLPGWLAFNRGGNFEGSEMASRSVHFAKGLQTYAVEQFYDQFYRRGLTRTSFTDAPPQAVASLDDALKTGTPPTVRIVSPTASAANSPTVEITVEATEQAGGGVKAIRLYHNDRLVGGPAALRGIAVEAVSGQTTTKKFTVPLAAGENSFRAVAYSKTDLESKPSSVVLSYQPAQIRKPTLYVLSVGINKYTDATMNLSYARPDAEAIADFFSKTPGESALFSRIQVSRLTDEQATGAAILGGIATVGKESTPDDVVLVYLAGHGETAGGVWHFLPAEMRQMALPERVTQLGIPWPKVEDAIGKINARKIVLVVDACKSGAALGAKTRGTDDSQQT
ncbi:MAG: caspase family protein, partial [Armatimonadota bacterium]